MYYPYLRGRQFEFIALREYALERGDWNNIIPIIEPVKKTFSSMKLAIPKLIEGDVRFALILNPLVGEIKDHNEITEALSTELKDRTKWIPAYIVSNNYNHISKIIIESGHSEVMLICTENTDSSQADFERLIASKNIKYILSVENKSLKRKLKGTGKELIRLDDNFKAQKRNSDYLLMGEEKFTEEHLFYEEDGYCGFSDYTMLVSDYTEGGAAPYAVAIHITYQKENREIWMRHFTSVTNDDPSHIQGKFAEAAEKAIRFLNSENIHTHAVEELRDYFNRGLYPGLGMIKKISIKHHLELMNTVLSSVEKL